MTESETRVSPAVVFDDLSNNQYFFSRHMPLPVWNAGGVLTLRDEASIRAGEHVRWEPWEHWEMADMHWDEVDEQGAHRWEWSPHHGWQSQTHWSLDHFSTEHHDYIAVIRGPASGYNSPEHRQLEQDAIASQLRNFRPIMEEFTSTVGLLYYLQTGTTTYSNVALDQQNIEYFRSRPVHFTYTTAGTGTHSARGHMEASHFVNFGWGWDWPLDATLYLAFTDEVISAQTGLFAAARTAYIRDFAIMGASALLILVLLAISILGAGRRRGVDGIYFQTIDRPYLDLSLAVLFGWAALSVVLFFYFVDQMQFGPRVAIWNMLFAVFAVFVGGPALLWLLSFAKRIKAGGFWRHTLLFVVPTQCGRRILHFVRSLWAGASLTAKVIVISTVSFFLMLLVGVMGLNTWHPAPIFLLSLLFTAVVTFFLLRYALRIYKLEQGAREAEHGIYDSEIQVGGGELGRIADSINNVSAGIHLAVDERMKSERLKTELITNVSHDIRTPLTSIITYVDLLKQEGLGSEHAPEYLDILEQKSQRLKILTEELFEAAKAATGNIEVNITPLDFSHLLNQVLGELDSAIQASDLELRINLPEHLYILADGKLLWRVMENLLSNVFKYALPGSRVYLDAVQEGPLVQIVLKNISATELNVDPAELTERFKRGDDSRTDGGTGLGLSIVQSFVNAQGGKFTIAIDGDLFKATVCLPSGNTEA